MQSIRDNFPALQQKIRGHNLIYLDNAATSLKPKQVIDALTNYYSNDTANIHRGAHYLANKSTIAYEETRDLVQNFINAKYSEEIIFTKGTTDSINLVATSFGDHFIKDNDEIIISTMEHHSNIVPWHLLSNHKKIKIKIIPIDDNGDILLDEYKKLFTSKTKLVSITHISNVLGVVNPIKEIINYAHQHGAFVLVDAAQSISHFPINVQEIDCDFLAFSAHKMFGPNGVGILYGKKNILEEMPPYQGGGNMIDTVSFESSTFNKIPHKFEAGTPAIAEVIAFSEAIKYINSIGMPTIIKIENDLLQYALSKMQTVKDLTIIGNPKHQSGVISFLLKNVHTYDVGIILDMQGIAIRTGHHCTQPLMKRLGVKSTARASFSIYNTTADIDQLIQGILKIKNFL